LAEGIASPVTFGVLRPVVLLPSQFPQFEPRVREAILRHELLHVRRRDWAFMVVEELVRAAFWFHPAVWWALGEIGLAREQEVDRLVVAATSAREEYVDALLAIAGAPAQLDLAPAPLFLRRRHLKHRVVSILEEVRMSKTRLISSLAAALCVVAAAGWLITATFPLAAAPEAVMDSPGVTVDIGSAQLMHRTAVIYPEAAREQGVEGTVVVQAAVDNTGSVTDAQVLSGPQELRKAALQSVLNWHFVADNSGKTRQVSITFAPGYAQSLVSPGQAAADAAAVDTEPAGRLKSITVFGLSDQARSDLLPRLPVHLGDTIEAAQRAQVQQAITQFDQHLIAAWARPAPGVGEVSLIVTMATAAPLPPPPSAPPATATAQPARIRVGGNVQSMKIVKNPRPTYPSPAKQARIQGVVKLDAVIAKDGTVADLTVISGHPLLVPSALEAVKQWVYSPTLLNGEPVEVETEVDVNYTLSQ
jgi:TonB family protein